MVTCCLKKCRKRTNLDTDGYCPDHTLNNAESENCGKCGQAVPNDQSSKALQCENEKCKVWFHLSCTSIPDELYDMINDVSEDEDAGIRWLCTSCRVKPLVPNTEATITEKGHANDGAKSICSKLKQGKCPHGISGQREVGGRVCEFSHPKFCKKFTRNGSGGRYGCKGCDNFHPTLCRNSVRFRKCFNQKCTFVHLKGTQRKEYSEQPFPPSVQYPPLAPIPARTQSIGFQNRNAWQGRQVPVSQKRSTDQNTQKTDTLCMIHQPIF